ncbi:MAG: hypothetical protein ACI9U2_004977 [Bradymonadia bacterium]|jgi:hypothetical protein
MTHLSDLQLDALGAGITDASVTLHLETCAQCAARNFALQAERDAFADRYDPQALARASLSRRRPRRRWFIGGLTLAASAAALFLLVRAPVDLPTERVKGASEPQLFVVEASDDPSPSDPRAIAGAVPPNSHLRLRFDPAGRRYVRVLWAGPDGHLSGLHPLASEPALSMDAGAGPRWLDHVLELDAEPRDEALLIVLCDTPMDHDEAIRRVEAPGSCAVTRVPVEKRL